MKQVLCGGRQIALMLPDDWTMEAEGTEEIHFHPRDNSGTLRVTVLTARYKEEGRDPKQELAKFRPGLGTEVVQLANGTWATSWETEPTESGTTLLMRSWSLCQVEGRNLTLATFTFTLEKSHASDPENLADMEMVDESIRSCELIAAPPPPTGGIKKFMRLFSK